MIEVTLPATAEAVWRAIREPSEIRRWFGWDYEGLEEEVEGIFIANAKSAEDEWALQVWGGDRFALEPRGGQTVLRITRGTRADGRRDGIYEGWITFAQQLRFALARHPGEERQTLYLPGSPAAAEEQLPAAALGVDGVASLPPGERYEIELPTGERIEGELWYRAERQTGLTVDGYGDGLLVVTGASAEEDPPYGSGTVLITTYGLRPQDFEELSERWRSWWAARFPG